MKASTTTNSELYENKVKATPLNELKNLDYGAHLHFMSNCISNLTQMLNLMQLTFSPGVWGV